MKNIILLKCFAIIIKLATFSTVTFGQLPATGEVQGVFNVSDIGSASYTIPIKAPDGIAGLQPSISLAYNSQGGNGIMGMGWSIAGISAITRVGRNIYHDKATAGVELSANDRFALDGNRLILISSGNYGGANTQYRTEIESYNTIKANGTLGSGPQSFTVTDQDGKVYEYGAVANARATIPGKSEPYMWLLNKVTDLNGNQITYHYTNSPGNEVLISAIRYNIDPNTAPNYKSYISSSYENRPDPNFKYLAGAATISSKRLKKVSAIQWDGYWRYFRSYDLNYETGIYTHLITISENGKDQDEAFTETTFDYGPASSGYQSATVSGNFSVAHEFVAGDYNGDGKSDLIQFTKNYTPSSNIWNLYLSTGANFTLTQTGNLPPSPSDYTENKKLPVNRDYAASFFDFNGDGKEDFVYRSKKPFL